MTGWIVNDATATNPRERIKPHWTEDGIATLCGRPIDGAWDSIRHDFVDKGFFLSQHPWECRECRAAIEAEGYQYDRPDVDYN